MNPARQTADLQQNGGLNCAQALLTVFGKPYGIDADTASALGRPLGGGIARQAGVCGYLTGALLIISLARHQPDEFSSRQASNEANKILFERFRELHGHLQCRNLLGADMRTQEGARRIAEENLIAKNCYGFGRDVAKILESLLK